MKPIPQQSPIRPLLWLLVIVVLIGAAALFVIFDSSNGVRDIDPTPQPSIDTSQKVTEGKLVCLPHKDMTGPITLECALGLKTETSDHYALDASAYNPEVFSELSMDATIAVTGSIAPLAQVLDTSIKKYDIVGVIHVADVEKKP